MVDEPDTRPVTPDLWPDLEALFWRGGWSRQCWCMVWRARAVEGHGTDRAFRKACMEQRVRSGEIVGLLAYEGDTPVGWCSIAPRPSYGKLGGPDDFKDDPGAVWSLTCFLVAKDRRRQGLSGRLLDAAIRYARENGARVVEAYPVDPESPSYQYMGFVPQFERRGFRYVQDAGKRRRVHRLDL